MEWLEWLGKALLPVLFGVVIVAACLKFVLGLFATVQMPVSGVKRLWARGRGPGHGRHPRRGGRPPLAGTWSSTDN